jgi:hypothetical protein
MTQSTIKQTLTTKSLHKKNHPISPAIKPGAYDEYLWNHPEEVQRILREHGINSDEIKKILDNGGGVILKDYETNHNRKAKA